MKSDFSPMIGFPVIVFILMPGQKAKLHLFPLGILVATGSLLEADEAWRAAFQFRLGILSRCNWSAIPPSRGKCFRCFNSPWEFSLVATVLIFVPCGSRVLTVSCEDPSSVSVFITVLAWRSAGKVPSNRDFVLARISRLFRIREIIAPYI